MNFGYMHNKICLLSTYLWKYTVFGNKAVSLYDSYLGWTVISDALKTAPPQEPTWNGTQNGEQMDVPSYSVS